MKNNRIWIWPVVTAVALAAGLCLGTVFSGQLGGGMFGKKRSLAGREKLMEVFNLIEDEYVDEISIDSLIEQAIPDLLTGLDPHSSYIPAEEVAAAKVDLEGQFSGVGITFQIMNDTLSVIDVISGGPAEKVGMMPGDRIVKVDSVTLSDIELTNEKVFKMLRGDKGTHVDVTVKRRGAKKPLTFSITRDDIPVESIDAAYIISPGVGYIRIGKFARHTFEEMLVALSQLRAEGAEKLILDLRYNGGGYMEPAVLMANEFLPAGREIVSTHGRKSSEDQMIFSDGSGAFVDYPMAVLVNEFSASSSEIFTGAMQDNDRAWIIGRRTFGKGLVQHPVSLSDGSEVRLTVQRYYTPSGRSIQKEYNRGGATAYEEDLLRRFERGESFSADSITFDESLRYKTVAGRTVYGGGGIMPDIFVPEDTTGVNSYYRALVNENLPSKYAYEYCDINRERLSKAQTFDELMKMLPNDNMLLNDFANYAAQNGVNKRPVYLNESRLELLPLIKGHIARGFFGLGGYYQAINQRDATIDEALKQLEIPLTARDDIETRALEGVDIPLFDPNKRKMHNE